ncbi:hypothetical protein AMS68_001373 [Peltaster fructicola]|uniref:Carboxylic ester hydrolase n=1 Tax=Peltaster fructicola TaxID=286661 RepID=A0A6H0XMC2_9PEZI|nr:hypothetical protein AMS68_001373 [Peltaster fructicola]
MVAIFLSLLVGTALASPLNERQLLQPSVKTTNGTVVGSYSSLGVDQFNGIPFAQPPVGDLRLKPPQPVKANWGTIQATGSPKACPQFITQVNESDPTSVALASFLDNQDAQSTVGFSEDCLTLNIFRPTGATSNSNYPVVFWIFGGGFELGWAGMYDFNQWVQQSILNGQPIVAVTVAYRVGGFGFLPGKELADEHSTNLGLRDQRLGLEWVADNIKAFGGDPSKVTIWGESAGAISVCDHTIINGGDNTYNGKPLFRGAIMNSGSVVPADTVRADNAQAIFDTVAQNANCGTADDKLACLRALDYETFLTATESVPNLLGPRSLDLSYLPRPDPGDNFFSTSPDVQLLSGNFAKVPVIIGDLEDEGTLFASSVTLQNNTELVDYLASYFPSDPNALQDVTQLAALYPDNPSGGQPDGSPFGTGPLYNTYPEQKRLAAILGDITFTLTRRVYLDGLTARGVTAYSYMADYLAGTPFLGTFHGSDLLVLFNQLTTLSFPHKSFQNYYLSFIATLDPNSNSQGQTTWPTYSSTRQIVNFGGSAISVITDNFRKAVSDYLSTKANVLKV